MNRTSSAVAIGLAGLLLMAAGPATAQYIFADTDGDGKSSSADRLARTGETKVDIWLETNRTRDGSPVAVLLGMEPLSIFSYEIALEVVGGTVRWGKYTNHMVSMALPFGRADSPMEFYAGFGGIEPLPPGKYRLGTIAVEVATGSPALEFRSRSTLHHLGCTSFGSLNPGKDANHTLKYTQDRSKLENALPGESHDWADADGVASPPAGVSMASELKVASAPRFAVVVGSNPGGKTSGRLSVTTTREGYLRVRIFDLQGRLVRELASEASAPASTRVFELNAAAPGRGALASGLYLYKVEASEGTRAGRVILVR